MLYIVLKLDFKNEKKNSFWSRFRNKFGMIERDMLLRIILFVIFYLLNLYTRFYVIYNSWQFVANYVTTLSQRGYTIKTFEDMFEERENPVLSFLYKSLESDLSRREAVKTN